MSVECGGRMTTKGWHLNESCGGSVMCSHLLVRQQGKKHKSVAGYIPLGGDGRSVCRSKWALLRAAGSVGSSIG